MAFWPSDVASQVGDVCSGLGLIASFAAWLQAKASKNAVKDLERKFARRDLLPREAEEYQARFNELQALLNSSPDTHVLMMTLGTYRGVVNGLDTHLEKNEKATLNQIKKRLRQLKDQPNNLDCRNALLEEGGAFSAELDVIVRKTEWNKPS